MWHSFKIITSEKGKELSIIDDVVSSHEDLLTILYLCELDIAEWRKPHIHTLHRTHKIEPIHESSSILEFKRQQVLKTSQSMPHYKACLDMIEEGIIFGGYVGVLKVSLITQNLKFFPSMQKLEQEIYNFRFICQVIFIIIYLIRDLKVVYLCCKFHREPMTPLTRCFYYR